MNFIFRFLLIVLLTQNNLFSQKSGYVIYEKVIFQKSEKTEPKSDAQSFVDKIFLTESTFDYKLVFSGNNAIFSIVKIPLDKKDINSEDNFILYGVMKTNTICYLNLDEQRAYNQDIDDKNFYTYSDFSKVSWEITNESKLIDGKLCFKATLTKANNMRSYKSLITAWFCPEIPVPFGPSNFGGLPGLILLIEFSNSAYLAKEIIFDDSIKVEKPKMTKVISNEEYKEKVIRNY
ncbi:MAG: GLPGLI family protein [Flavobacterium sp.]